MVTGKERGIASAVSYEAKARGVKRGMSADKALAALTAKDIEDAIHVASRDQRYKRLLRKIVRRRGNGSSGG